MCNGGGSTLCACAPPSRDGLATVSAQAHKVTKTSQTQAATFHTSLRRHSGWEGSTDKASLGTLWWGHTTGQAGQHSIGGGGSSAAVLSLLVKREYKIQAPALDPKERKFVGYAQPFQKIRWLNLAALDWTPAPSVQ